VWGVNLGEWTHSAPPYCVVPAGAAQLIALIVELRIAVVLIHTNIKGPLSALRAE
jgi:hypothetical protein